MPQSLRPTMVPHLRARTAAVRRPQQFATNTLRSCIHMRIANTIAQQITKHGADDGSNDARIVERQFAAIR
jgi:hypothetical protein